VLARNAVTSRGAAIYLAATATLTRAAISVRNIHRHASKASCAICRIARIYPRACSVQTEIISRYRRRYSSLIGGGIRMAAEEKRRNGGQQQQRAARAIAYREEAKEGWRAAWHHNAAVTCAIGAPLFSRHLCCTTPAIYRATLPPAAKRRPLLGMSSNNERRGQAGWLHYVFLPLRWPLLLLPQKPAGGQQACHLHLAA